MDKYEIAVIDTAMEFALADHALSCGTPAQAMKKKAEADLLDACGNLAAENEGEWRTEREPAPEFTLRRFHNGLRLLMNIDMAEFIEAVFGKDYGEFGEHETAEWKAFRANPHRWFIAADDDQATKIWNHMQTRMK